MRISERQIDISIGVLWDPYRWLIGSATLVGIDERESELIENIIKRFQNTETRPIIAVGLASHENSENPGQEEFRANARADKLVALCQSHFIAKPEIYKLNLGVHKNTGLTSVESATERRVILLVITKRENDTDLDSGVRNALIEAKNNWELEFDPNAYSNFSPEKFHVGVKTPIINTQPNAVTR